VRRKENAREMGIGGGGGGVVGFGGEESGGVEEWRLRGIGRGGVGGGGRVDIRVWFRGLGRKDAIQLNRVSGTG